MAAKKEKNLGQSGQALFEFFFFIPLFLAVFALCIYLGNAINGAINQQKIARSYLYARLKGNSYAPEPDSRTHPGWQKFGMYIIGYREKFSAGGTEPVSPCFKVNVPFVRDITQECEDSYTDEATNFIRVQTVYGICGATYGNRGPAGIVQLPYSVAWEASTIDACLIQ